MNKNASFGKKLGYRNCSYVQQGNKMCVANLKDDNEKRVLIGDKTSEILFSATCDPLSLKKDSTREKISNDNKHLKTVNKYNNAFVRNKQYIQELFKKNGNKKGAPKGNIRVIFSSDKKRRKELKKKIKESICIRKKKKKRKEFEERKKYKELLNAKIEEERKKGVFYILPKHLRIKKKSKLKKAVLLEKEIKNEICQNLLERKKLKELHADLFYLIKNRRKWNIPIITYTRERLCKKKKNKGDLCTMYTSNRYFSNHIRKEIYLTIIQIKKSERFMHAESIQERPDNSLNNNNSDVYKAHIYGRNYKERSWPIKESKKNVNQYDFVKCEKKEDFVCENTIKDNLKRQIEKNSEIINYIKKSQIEKKLFINSYVNQEITEEFNNMVKDFLIKIKKSHEKYLQKNKKRYILGLKESYKHICVNEPKLVIIAPNIEPLQNNAFSDMIQNIVLKCKEKNIPLVYALSRNSLGKCLNTLRQSIVCIMHIDSFEKEYKEIVKMSEFLKR